MVYNTPTALEHDFMITFAYYTDVSVLTKEEGGYLDKCGETRRMK